MEACCHDGLIFLRCSNRLLSLAATNDVSIVVYVVSNELKGKHYTHHFSLFKMPRTFNVGLHFPSAFDAAFQQFLRHPFLLITKLTIVQLNCHANVFILRCFGFYVRSMLYGVSN